MVIKHNSRIHSQLLWQWSATQRQSSCPSQEKYVETKVQRNDSANFKLQVGNFYVDAAAASAAA